MQTEQNVSVLLCYNNIDVLMTERRISKLSNAKKVRQKEPQERGTKWECDEPTRESSWRTVPSSIDHVVMLFEALGGAGTGEM